MTHRQTRRCPACERLFDRDEAYCPFDASELEPWIPDDPLIGRLVADRYRLLHPLGSGGMGVVYAAEQAPIGRKVAVKLLKHERAANPKALTRFEQEARMISALKSPHTVTLFEFGQADDGALFLAMELLEGQTLRELLTRRGRLTVEELAPILDQVARGLSEAHDKGLVHRDIKPDNIFLSRSADYTQFVKLLDFGVAATLETGDTAGLTGSGELPGTPGYLAPERILGEPFDARADVYSLGVTMYQALTGRLPFRNSGNWDVLVAHLHADPLPLEDVAPGLVLPDAVVGLLWRCIAKHPASRPADAAEFRTELLRALQVSDQASWSYDTGLVPPVLAATTEGRPASPPPPAPRRRWRDAAAAVAVVGALLSGYFIGQTRPDTVAASEPTAAADAPRSPSPPAALPPVAALAGTGGLEAAAMRPARVELAPGVPSLDLAEAPPSKAAQPPPKRAPSGSEGSPERVSTRSRPPPKRVVRPRTPPPTTDEADTSEAAPTPSDERNQMIDELLRPRPVRTGPRR